MPTHVTFLGGPRDGEETVMDSAGVWPRLPDSFLGGAYVLVSSIAFGGSEHATYVYEDLPEASRARLAGKAER